MMPSLFLGLRFAGAGILPSLFAASLVYTVLREGTDSGMNCMYILTLICIAHVPIPRPYPS